MKNILTKLLEARKIVATTKIEKKGFNAFSNYKYFEPEQIKILVDEACFRLNLMTILTINDGIARLDVVDIETEEKITFQIPYIIPEITATNKMQQIGGVVTFSERYLKMMAFGIVDNTLDFDTTENTQKVVEKKEEKQKENVIWTSKEEFEKLMQIDEKERLKKGLEYYTTSPRAMKKEWKAQIIEKIKNYE